MVKRYSAAILAADVNDEDFKTEIVFRPDPEGKYCLYSELPYTYHPDIVEFCNCFPYFKCYVNKFGEMIVEESQNIYFIVTECACKEDLQNKAISALSRPAYKGVPAKISKRVLEGLNQYLGTSFDEKAIEEVYTYFGNGANEGWRKKFVQSGFDMQVIQDLIESRKSQTVEEK